MPTVIVVSYFKCFNMISVRKKKWFENTHFTRTFNVIICFEKVNQLNFVLFDLRPSLAINNQQSTISIKLLIIRSDRLLSLLE